MRRTPQQSKRYRAINRGQLTKESWDSYKKRKHA